MNSELSEKLHTAFPKFFQHCSFECGDGWYQLIFDTAYEIEKQISIEGLNPDETYATQVEEKFGELRIYLTSATDAIFEIEEKALAKSKTICEQCGKPGRLLNVRRWLYTACEECHP